MAEVLTVTELSVHIWHAEEIPKEWREGIIIPVRYPKKDVSATAVVGEGQPSYLYQARYSAVCFQQTENSCGSTAARGTSMFLEWKVMH